MDRRTDKASHRFACPHLKTKRYDRWCHVFCRCGDASSEWWRWSGGNEQGPMHVYVHGYLSRLRVGSEEKKIIKQLGRSGYAKNTHKHKKKCVTNRRTDHPTDRHSGLKSRVHVTKTLGPCAWTMLEAWCFNRRHNSFEILEIYPLEF